MTGAPRLLVLIASTRRQRIGGAIGRWVAGAARGRGDVDVDVVDLRELALPLHDEPAHPRLGQYEGEPALAWSVRVAAADGFVFVMPEYNHSYSAPLKNALDYLHAEWAGKPVGLVSYGGLSGGTRAVVALQPVLVNLSMRQPQPGVELAWASAQVADGVFAATDRQEAALAGLLERVRAAMG